MVIFIGTVLELVFFSISTGLVPGPALFPGAGAA
jgi:hypothetical protein